MTDSNVDFPVALAPIIAVIPPRGKVAVIWLRTDTLR